MNIKLKYLLITLFSLLTFNTIVNVLARKKHKTDYIKVAQANVKNEEIAIIKQRAHTIITKIEKGEYFKFSKENTGNDIVEKIDITIQKSIHKYIKNKFGAYKSLQFESLFKSKTQNPFTNKVYRFKGEFESKKDIEIRLYLSSEKEIVGLNVLSWKKELF